MPPTQPEQRAAVAGMARSHEVRCRGHGPLLPQSRILLRFVGARHARVRALMQGKAPAELPPQNAGATPNSSPAASLAESAGARPSTSGHSMPIVGSSQRTETSCAGS